MKQIFTFQEDLADLKITATPLTVYSDNSQTSELSNEVLQVLVSQGVAELQAVKVVGQKKADILGSRLRFLQFYVVIAKVRVRFPAGADFGGLQLELQRPIAPFWKPLPLTILG